MLIPTSQNFQHRQVMKPAIGRRARTDDAKELRREALLACARRMLQTQGSGNFTMAVLADEADLAKGTAYLYFPSREALFVAILTEDLRAFFAGIVRGLPRLSGRDLPLMAAKLIADALLSCPTLLPLLQLLHTQLERNVPFEVLAEFKAFLLAQLQIAGASLETAVGLRKGAGATVFLRAHALAVGMSQMADRSEALQEVYRRHPELSALAIDFKREFSLALADQIRAFRRAVRKSQ
jgi:AcrR family transcriptional regulator